MQIIDVIKSFIFKSLYFFAGAIICLQVMHLDQYVSLCFYITFILTIAFWVICAGQGLAKTELLMLVAVIVAIINVLINAAVYDYAVTVQYIKKLLSFLSALLFFSATYKTQPNNAEYKWLYSIIHVVSYFLIFSYFFQKQQMYEINGIASNYLTFGFTNPNLTGLFLAGIVMLQINQLFSLKYKWKRMICFIEICCLLYFIWETQARNALFAVLIFLIFLCLTGVKKSDFIFSKKFVSWLISLWPMLFAITYLLLIQVKRITKWFYFLETPGKDIGSRTEIWERFIRLWTESPLFGAYGQASNGTGSFQCHNTHIDILVSYGPIVLLLVCMAIFSLIYLGGTHKSKYKRFMTVGFASTMLLGTGEAAIFSGGLSIYLYVGAFLLLRNYEPNESGYVLKL